MSAAFDLLRHSILSQKMAVLKVPVGLRKIIQSFLSNRRSYVSVDGHNSTVRSANIGVPQGSVLGPKLFSIYTMGLPEHIENNRTNIVVYADDSYVICEGTDEQDLKNQVANTIDKHTAWLCNMGMIVNASKTDLMSLGRKIEVQGDGFKLVSSSTLNVLGILFDEKMCWEPQLELSMSKCQRLKPALRCLSSKLKKSEMLQVITSHFYSRLYYGSEVWYHSLTQINRNRLSAIHYYPLRLATKNFSKLISRKTLNLETQRASPNEINDYKIARLLYSIVANTSPFTLFHEVMSHAVIEERRRPNNPNFLDMSRVRIGKQCFANRLNSISKGMTFPWLLIDLSPDSLRKSLKKCFFSYLQSPLPRS